MKTALLLSIIAIAACTKDRDKPGAAPGSAAPAAAPGGETGGAPIAMKDGADGLKAVFEASHAACTSKDFKKGRALTMSLVPGKAQLQKIMKDTVPDAQLDQLVDQFKELPPNDEAAACVFYPGQNRTEIRVHASSVEDLVANKEGTPAAAEFPGGARTLAETVLKPGTTFYEVEVTEPGKDLGTKYHMFFWDGQQWRMLGPAWRVFKSE